MSKHLSVPVRWVRRCAGEHWLIIDEPGITQHLADATVFAVLERWKKSDGKRVWWAFGIGLSGCGDLLTLAAAKAAVENALGVHDD